MSPTILWPGTVVGRGEQELGTAGLPNLLPDFRRLRLALWGSIREQGMNAEC
jgi:hypothetical protein